MRRLVELLSGIVFAVGLGLPGISRAAGTTTVANSGDWGKFEVGSTIIYIQSKGLKGEPRPMDVLLWYPADKQAYPDYPLTVYSSRLLGVPLDPARWDPFSWTVAADRAHDGAPVDQRGPAFPLVIMSHSAAGEPHNYAPTLERLASHGFIIAAPWHDGDTQDDRRIDLINQKAGKTLLACFDGQPSPCLDAVQKAVQLRALDVTAVIDNIGSYFGSRIDMDKIGLMGQSRGSITALAAAGGSTLWNIKPEPRVSAIMTMAIGTRVVTFSQDLANITVPSLLVAGKIDRNTPMPISVDAYNVISAEDKALVILERAEHRSYGSSYCAQTQASGAIWEANPRAFGEFLTLDNIINGGLSGNPLDYCYYDTFVNPVDIRPVVQTMTGYLVTETNVPRQESMANVMRVVLELANVFFDASLVKKGQPEVHFKQYLSPDFLLYKEGDVVSYEQSVSFQGRPSACDDPDLASLDSSCSE